MREDDEEEGDDDEDDKTMFFDELMIAKLAHFYLPFISHIIN